MKIGILTFANVPNFGANLQALSTISYLQNHGYNPILIKWSQKILKLVSQVLKLRSNHKSIFIL